MNATSIEYLDFTVNPIVGCDMSLPCAERCWARRMARRLRAAGVPQYQTVVDDKGNWAGKTAFNETELTALLRKRKPAMVGWNFMGDMFQESVCEKWIDRCAGVVALTPHLKHLWLTKRSKRMREYFSNTQRLRMKVTLGPLPLPNLGLGVSCEDQKAADERILELLATPAAMRFVSVEPLLGPVDLDSPDPHGTHALGCGDSDCHVSPQCKPLDWVICGGESGPGARHGNLDWARSLRDQCVAANVPFLLKQAWIGGKLVKMPVLDGKIWEQRPEGWG